MKLIRNSIFETNSSSTHSICISQGDIDLYSTIVPSDDGIINVEPKEFGWEQQVYTRPEDKLSYLMIYIRDWVKDGIEKEEFTKVLTEVVCNHTGATGLNLMSGEHKPWGYEEGYIDHQSVECDDLHYLFEEDKDRLKDFLFNPNSYVETDNDNH